MDNFFLTLVVLSTIGSFITIMIIYFSPGDQLHHAPIAIVGPTFQIWIGLRKSCMQQEASDVECTADSFEPTYDFSLLPPDAPAFVLQKPPIIFRVIFVTTVITSGLLIFLSVLAAGQYWKPAAERFSPFNKLADPSLRKLWNRVVLKLTVVLAFFNIAIGPLSYKLMDLYYRTMRQHFIAFVSARHPDITANIGTTPTYAYVCNSLAFLPGILAGVIIYQENSDEEKAAKAAKAAQERDAATKKTEEEAAKARAATEARLATLATLIAEALKK